MAEALTDVSRERVLLSRSQVRASGPSDAFYRKLHATLGSFLQIKNLSALIGAGAAYHLGSPRIRSMTAEHISEMVARAQLAENLPERGQELMSALVTAGGGSVDLEHALSSLTAAMTVAEAGGESAKLSLNDIPLSTNDLSQTRRVLNHALALDCDLPKTELIEDEDTKRDPLRFHRSFFRKLLKARRIDLPRLRVFTTNYDLIIEQSLDASGISYFDGFHGTVRRRFRPEAFDQDLYLPPEAERRLLRVPDVLYLYKIHGSITWRSRPGAEAGGPTEVVESRSLAEFEGDELALIFPTPQKESDSVGYPYSALFRSFSEALQRSDSALLTVGYGFADDHINRLIYQALGNPSFQLFAVAPYGVLSFPEESGGADTDPTSAAFEKTILGALASSTDPRIHVMTGSVAGTFADLADNGLPEAPELDTEELTNRTQAELAPAFFQEPSDSDDAD